MKDECNTKWVEERQWYEGTIIGWIFKHNKNRRTVLKKEEEKSSILI